MAKTSANKESKTTSASPAKVEAKAPAKKKAASKSTVIPIEKACETALAKLRELNLDLQLQSEIDWCLGSFRGDNNPIGLFEMVQRSILVFKPELEKKTKGVNAKLISDLETALNTR
jgi:hypothetical protein